jgi:pimeloyl-ACP methyl ester carboxylesterase
MGSKEDGMDDPINLFKSPKGQARYFGAYDAAMDLWPVPHESQFITTSYGRTHVITCGPRSGYPLLVLHAGQASSTMWFPNVAALAKQFRIYALDTPGEPGKSVPTRRNDSRQDCSAWLEGVMAELGLARAHVLGLSRGAWLALNLAMQAPGRLDRIILLSPAAAFVKLNSFFSAVASAVMRIPTRSVARFAMNSWVAKGFVMESLWAEQFMVGLQNWNWKVNSSGYAGIMPCLFSDEQLQKVDHNVLLLIGDQDRLNPPRAFARAKRTIQHLHAEVIPQAGHFLNMEKPAAVNEKMLKFLTQGTSAV